MYITDADLSSGAEDSTSIPVAGVFVADSSVMKAGLTSSEELTFEGVAEITIPADVCNSVRFVCVSVLKHSSATWVEATESNNYICHDLTETATVECTPGKCSTNSVRIV